MRQIDSYGSIIMYEIDSNVYYLIVIWWKLICHTSKKMLKQVSSRSLIVASPCFICDDKLANLKTLKTHLLLKHSKMNLCLFCVEKKVTIINFYFNSYLLFCDMLYSPDEFRNIFDRVGPITLLVNHHIMNITGNSTREW